MNPNLQSVEGPKASQCLPYFYTPPLLNQAQNRQVIPVSGGVFPIACDADSEFWITCVHRANFQITNPNVTSWNVVDGTKRQLFQNPSVIPFFSYPMAPAWKILPGGQINQTLYEAPPGGATSLPLFLFQGLRVYPESVAYEPDYTYKEEPYMYPIPFSLVGPTVNPPGILQTSVYQAINNYAFRLKRISVVYFEGPTNTAAIADLGCKIFDWQLRQLMNDWVPTQFVDFNSRDSVGNSIYGPHASFPAIPLTWPVNGQIRIDLTDILSQIAGSITDIQGQFLYEGVNLIPCGLSAPGAIRSRRAIEAGR